MRNLDELRWEQFHIGDIFSVERPSARNKDNYEDGDVPFVASGAINNRGNAHKLDRITGMAV